MGLEGGGFGDSDYLAVWDHILLPVAEKYNPDLVLISAGFDSGEKNREKIGQVVVLWWNQGGISDLQIYFFLNFWGEKGGKWRMK